MDVVALLCAGQLLRVAHRYVWPAGMLLLLEYRLAKLVLLDGDDVRL